ncbi:MAG: hypothetical protein JSV02_02980 [Dehalococcoidia bacterium]|nr:MAG: hypothetical protein JSV02_02980 [Dehalococcoidia bacterium]
MKTSISQVRYHLFIIVLVGLLVMAVVFSISCGEEEQSTPSTPAPSVPVTEEWVADGTISVGEYSNSQIHGNYEIHWKSDEEYIYAGMKARTGGYVSVGFQPGSRMKNADMVFGFIADGEVTIYDMYSTGDFGPHPPDTDLGGTFDIAEFGGKEEGSFTIIEFKRELATGDQYDNPLLSGVNKIIWSYGSSDSLTRQHSNRGYGEIEL